MMKIYESKKTCGLLVLAVGLLLNASTIALADSNRTLFIQSAVENPDGTVTLPVYQGMSQGRTVWYIILDSSDGKDADQLRVNRSSKLANARYTTAAQKITVVNGKIDFPQTVDFKPVNKVVAGPQGFPPTVAMPGAIGAPGYSPLIQMPDGTIRNAPQIANDTGQAEKVVRLDIKTGKVTYRTTRGFANGKAVSYLSTDASDQAVAALENVTFAPALNAAPFAGDDSTDSARASLVAFTNGQTGVGNPQRQGLNSALLNGLDPLNLLFWTPNQGRYSPLWDVFPAQWSAAAVSTGKNLRQTDRSALLNQVQNGVITGPNGVFFGPGGFIVNCPIVSSD
jgi:hypothetical protein